MFLLRCLCLWPGTGFASIVVPGFFMPSAPRNGAKMKHAKLVEELEKR